MLSCGLHENILKFSITIGNVIIVDSVIDA